MSSKSDHEQEDEIEPDLLKSSSMESDAEELRSVIQRSTESKPKSKRTLNQPQPRLNFSTRCKYWPNCARGNKCFYVHPTKLCKKFPNCPYRQNCRYVHPICPRNRSCEDPKCGYTHNFCEESKTSLQNLEGLMMELLVKPMQLYDSNYNLYASGLGIGDSVDPNLTMCKYLGKCEDIQCKFRHPRVCKYGDDCPKQETCIFRHLNIGSSRFQLSPSPSPSPSSSKDKIDE